jgi:hypothetical protein
VVALRFLHEVLDFTTAIILTVLFCKVSIILLLMEIVPRYETNRTRNRNIRVICGGINEFKKGYQPRTSIAKDENYDLLSDSYNIVNIWKSYICQLWNVLGVNMLGRQKCI